MKEADFDYAGAMAIGLDEKRKLINLPIGNFL